jgi:phage gp36-like protein
VYCERTDLTDFVLDAYLTAAEGQKPGVVEKAISDTTSIIDDALRARFVLPLSTVPATIKEMAAVIAAYRAIGSVTSIMKSEGGSNNEWIPLQTQYKQAMKNLELLRNGKLNLGLSELGQEPQGSEEVIVITRKPVFDLKGY